MANEIYLTRVGMTMTEGTVAEWIYHSPGGGDTVSVFSELQMHPELDHFYTYRVLTPIAREAEDCEPGRALQGV